MKKTISCLIILGFLLLIYFISFRQALLFAVGLGYGAILAGMGFGFTSGWRRYIEKRETNGIAAQFLLILILFLFSTPVILLFPQISPANASISYSLLIGAFVFGLFMQLADGCGSGTLFKAGMLKTYNLLVFLGFVVGAFWGSVDIPYWLGWGSIFPVFNLIQDGIAGSKGLGILVGGSILMACLWFFWNPKKSGDNTRNRNLIKGAVGLAILAWINLIVAGQPWGIVYGLGLWGAKAKDGLAHLGWGTPVIDTLYWGSGYASDSLKSSLLLDSVSITNIGLLLGAFHTSLQKQGIALSPGALWTKKDYLVKPVVIIAIGIVLGYSSRLAFGCNIGAFVSGISTGSIHGWVWAAMAFSGSVVGVRIRRTNLIRYLHS